MEPVDLFYSYAHEDEKLRDELDGHLALLRRKGVIRPGHPWIYKGQYLQPASPVRGGRRRLRGPVFPGRNPSQPSGRCDLQEAPG